MGQKAFEALLQRIEHSPDREALAGLASKYPFLAEGVATQDELAGIKVNLTEEKNRLSTKFNELNTRLASAETELGVWHGWKDRAWDPDKKMTKSEALVRQQLETLERENDLLRSQEGDEMTLEQLDRYFTEKASRGEIVTNKALEGQLAKLIDRDTYATDVAARLGSAAGMFGEFLAKTMPLYLRHYDEFGKEILDLDKVVELAQAAHGGDIPRAYEAFTAQRRKERTDKQRQEELAEAEKRGFEKAQQQRAMSAENLPVDMGAPMGHLQERFSRPPTKDGEQVQGPPEGVELGSMGLARLAAADAIQGGLGKGNE